MRAPQSVVIKLGNGNLNKGFERVTTQLSTAEHTLPQQFTGSLPPAPDLVELYKNWQSIYQALCDRLNIPSRLEQDNDDELEIDEGGITSVSESSFDELGQKLQEDINAWLNCEGFRNIDQQLRSALDTSEEIQVIIETDDQLVQRLPWHLWDLWKDYPQGEIALSRPEYKRVRCSQPKVKRKKVRILAILGNSKGIDLDRESKFLQNLQDAETVFLVKPSRQEFNRQLWDEQGWDILFFAGHSYSEGETGRIYINENQTNNSLRIEQLEEALKAAINNGLKLAIFNSCDGLGLANALEKLKISTIIVMREPVPNLVAQEFFRHFLGAFAQQRLSLYLAVQQARRKLQGLEDEFFAASWLPVIFQNPAVETPSWLQLGGIPPCPYRGLFAFREEDARLFFGREQFTTDLVAAVKKKPLVAVVGPSGSGKSSIVFAGLIPNLRQDTNIHWQIVWFRPGKNPLEALATALVPLWRKIDSKTRSEFNLSGKVNGKGTDWLKQEEENVEQENSRRLLELELELALQQDEKLLSKILETFVQQNPGTRLVLIADQFEELYTLGEKLERQPFLDGLLNAVRLAPAFTLVLTLRADFCGYALAYRPLSDALQDGIEFLGPMNREELQDAIEKPAAQMQVKLEEGLVHKLIHAMNEQPGRLPLLEFALMQLWSNQQEGWLTNKAYDEIGGVEEALANHAELVYAQLEEEERQRVQRVFIQLIQPGAGTDDSRRTATRDDVQPENWDLVARLASSRLVVTNRNESIEEETVEIVHEALIGGWKRLRNWMQLDREFRLWQEQLRATMGQWEKSDQDEGALLRGKVLADAEYWHERRRDELSLGEQTFIQQSLALRDHQLKAQKRRRRLTISGLTSGLVVALMLAGVALQQWQKSARSEIKAITASSEALFVSHNKLDALIEAIRARQKLPMTGGVDTKTKTKVDSVLRQAVYGVVEYNRLSRHRNQVKTVAFSPDGNTIASASDDQTVKLWKRDGTLISIIEGHGDKLWQVAFSPDGQMLASTGKDKTIKLWKIEADKTPVLLRTLVGHRYDVRGVAFSPDGNTIASASDDQTVKLWKRDGTLITTLTGHTAVLNGVAFSPDGNMLASASDDQTVKLWKRDGTLITTLTGHTDIVNGVAFSPDGQMLASASWDKTIKLWKLETGKMPTLLATLTGHSEVVYGVAFSPDSQTLASGSWDNSVKLWKRDGTLITTLSGHSDRVWGVAFSPDGQTIASASGDKTVKLWKVKNPLLTRFTGHNAVVIGLAFSPDGQTIASGSDDKTVKLWQRDGTLIASLTGHTAQAYEVAFSPDSQKVASASADNTVKLWKVGQKTPQLFTTLGGDQAVMWGVDFSSDGQIVAAAAWDNTVKLWNVGTRIPQLLTTLRGHQAAIFGVAFSPDSKTLASSSADNTIKLWRVKPPQKPVLLRTLTGHTAQIYSVTFSPDGQTIASASADNTVKLWKPDGTLLMTLKGHNSVVYSVAFSPDGQTIASSSWDKTIKLWKPDGTLLTTLNGYSGRFWAIRFSPDGQTIAAANEDKTIILWNKEQVLSLNPLMQGCDWVGDYLKTNPNVSERDRTLCGQKSD